MMRKFTFCLVFCATWLLVSSCNDDVSAPPQATLSVSGASDGLSEVTEISFTVTQVGADAISLLPYGTAHMSWGGVLIPASSFTNGTATVKFTYTQVGEFDAVVVTNNHTASGDVKNSLSNTVPIKITSDKVLLSEFSFDKISTKTVLSQVDKTIDVTVPYGTDLTKLKASYTVSPFTSVKVGGTEQSSGATENNFTADKLYLVTAANGTTNVTYTVHVIVTPINTDTSFKSIAAKVGDNLLGWTIATTGNDIILYDSYDADIAKWNKVVFNADLNNPFAAIHTGTSSDKWKKDLELDLSTAPVEKVTVAAQDSTTSKHTYNIFAVKTPLPSLVTANPETTTVSVTTRFVILVKALKGEVTDSKLNMKLQIDDIAGITVMSANLTDISHGTRNILNSAVAVPIDFSDAVTLVLHVDDSNLGLEYDLTYSAGLTELK